MSVKDLKKHSVVLIHGRFDKDFFNGLAKRGAGRVFVLEGRPDFATAKHAAKELLKRKIRPVIVSDNMAGFLFFREYVKEVWVSCLTSDKDGFMCAVGSLILAVLGKKHKVPVRAVQGDGESRLMGDPRELCYFNGVEVAPPGTKAYVPLADWVDRKYISKVI